MIRRIIPIFLTLLILTAYLPLSVFAANEGSVTIHFKHENQPMPGAAFQIYRVAAWNGDAYELAGDFKDYAVILPSDVGSDDWKATATTLAAYAARDGIEPDGVGSTDENGTVRFDGLSDGLYLVTGTPMTKDDVLFLPQPMLVSVPFEHTDGTLDREIVAEPKYEFREPDKKLLERRVIKIWEDSDNKEDRPNEITVQLLRDGEVYDEQTLNEANNWRYTWGSLDASHDWQIVEKKVPENYTVKIEQQGVTFTVTNTNDNPPPPPPPPEKLPQTGILWWPVPVLFGAGFIILIAGVVSLYVKKEKNDA